MDKNRASSKAPANLKDSPTAQFEYGRASEHATLRYDPDSRRLETGNPDVGEVDLGTIEADRPAKSDRRERAPDERNPAGARGRPDDDAP